MNQPPPDILPSIHARLRSLRRRVRLWHAVGGLGRVLAAMLLLAAVDLALDWFVRMDRAQRLICAGLAAAALAAVVYRRLLRPLGAPLGDDALVLRVEGRHRQLRQSLISALQFVRHRPAEPARHVSPALVDATIEQGVRSAAAVDFREVLNSSGFARNVAILAVLALAWAGVGAAVATTQTMRIWFDRNVLLADRAWPQDTQFEIVGASDGRLSIPRGDDHQQAVLAEGIVPELVKLDYAPQHGATVTMPMTRHGDRAFHATFKNVLEPFRFRVRGGDAVTPWIEVDLVDRPAVEEFRLEMTPPGYVGSGPEVVWAFQTQDLGSTGDSSSNDTAPAAPRGTSAVYALKGSRLSIAARANKPLSQVALRGKGQVMPTRIAAGDPARFSAVIGPQQLVAGIYEIDLADASGPPPLASRQPTRFTVRIRPDRVPTIQAKLLGISGMVVSRAVIPIEMTLQDDFAVTQARLASDWHVPDEARPRGERAMAKLDAVGGRGQAKIQHVHRLELPPMKLPVGADLTFHVEADDNDTVSGPKTGKSAVFYVKVVEEQDLRADLLRREQEQRQEFERLIRTQEELAAETQGVAGESAAAAGLTDEQRRLLADIQKRQHLCGTRCDAIARQFHAIDAEVANNRLEEPDGPIHRRVRGKIIEPLEAIASRRTPTVAAELEKARQSSVEKPARGAALDSALAAQNDIVQTMREILKHMLKWEGYQEAVNLALEVLKAQEDVNESTKKAIRKRLEGVFGGEEPKADKQDR